MSRKFPRRLKRVVVKVGSSVIATYAMKPRTARLRSLVQQMSALRKKGLEMVLVSSGAIVLGLGQLGEKLRPSDVPSLQVSAALGQTALMQTYHDFFKRNKTQCAQLLLTWDDFDNRQRFNNARNTILALLKRGIIPVINENDTISTDEIKFGDNDKLSALVASLIQADLLLILSDVSGLYDLKSGKKKLFKEIKEITQDIEGVASGPSQKNISKGGMIAKLEAIKMATHANIPCVIVNGETPDVLKRVIKGERIGTFFLEKEEKSLARKHWISFSAKPKGQLIIDQGAQKALLNGGKSLLLPGVIEWNGHFKKEDVVVVLDKQHKEIARGIVNYSITDLHRTVEKKGKQEVIHRDNLVLCQR